MSRATSAALVVFVFALTATAQLSPYSQTLPPEHEQIEGNYSTDQPFFSGAISHSQRWQWAHDASLFAARGPMVIQGLSLRANAGGALAPFAFPMVEVVMASATTDYLSLATENLDANLGADQVVVRPESPWVGAGAMGSGTGGTAEWVSLDLATPFVYDPTLGAALIIQVRSCGFNVPWNQRLDAAVRQVGADPV